MKLDGALISADLARAGAEARRLEELGYDGAVTFEGPHDPFLPLALAAPATEHLELATGIAVAFARTPMLLAHIAHDLQSLSRGRFILGLGSQIRPHIERRYGMPWSRPAARMRELVQAIRAIWTCWDGAGPLDFRGEFYSHTLMTPMFNPGPNAHGNPRIFLAGVGPRMTEVAGEVADGFIVHPFHSPQSLARDALPALERGLEKSGRARSAFEISAQVLVVTGAADQDVERARAAVRSQLAFYGSTPAYRRVLDCHGWGDLQPELRALSKQGRWSEMAELVSDELLETIAVCASPDALGKALRERCASYADRIAPSAASLSDPALVARSLRDITQ